VVASEKSPTLQTLQVFGDKIYQYSLNVFPGKKLFGGLGLCIFAKLKRKSIETFHFFPRIHDLFLGVLQRAEKNSHILEIYRLSNIL
jgi:hypothetical protein